MGEHREAERREVVVRQALHARIDDVANLLALGLAGQSNAGLVARRRRLVALVAAEDEVDRRQEVAVAQQVDDVEPRRREHA